MIFWCILLVTILIWLFYEWIEHTMIEYGSTTVECSKLNPEETVKLCVIADLHNNKKNLTRICAEIKAYGPDGILIPGDMVNKHGRSQQNAIAIFKELVKIAPVYYSFGNHEEKLRTEKDIHWENYVEKLPVGVTLLDNTSVTTTIGKRDVCISGLSLPQEYYRKGRLLENTESLPKISCKTDGLHLLLAHNPEYAEWYADYHPDVVFSGHLHGGLLRLPYVGGVLSPRLRIPREDAGAYPYPFGTLFVTRGLGSHTIPLRFFNRAEVNFIVLCGENK